MRRHLLRVCALLPVLSAKGALAASLTPQQAEGPFYPTDDMRPADQDNDLVRIASKVRDAGGDVVHLTGRVRDGDGLPIAGARVEIWQVDMNARYIHTGDRATRPRDEMFQGFGHAITDPQGRYTFRTITPVPYPGRPPHIHVKVIVGGEDRLTTQFYLKDHPANAGDGSWRRLSEEERASVAMVFEADATGVPTASVDIVI